MHGLAHAVQGVWGSASRHEEHPCILVEMRTYQVRLVHGLAHAVQGVWGSASHHEVWGCLYGPQGIHAAEVGRPGAWLKAGNDGRDEPGPKPARLSFQMSCASQAGEHVQTCANQQS